jgi:formylglycine-generating enzyme required for sulfatase activity
MGSDHHYPEEAPAHRVTVAPFWIDRTPVTNRQFKQFVAATGYLTVAEIAPEPKDYPDALPHMLKPGSLVFTAPKHPVDLRDWSQWWRFALGANWRHPFGREKQRTARSPGGSYRLQGRPGVCRVGGKETTDGAEWEFAARAGLNGAEFAWGDELEPGGRHMANTWQGMFPLENLATDGYQRTSPVRAFPPNAYGVYDMIGNVWEWTTDWFSSRYAADAPKACCIPENPRGGPEANSYDPLQPSLRIPRKVVKGGSHLCAANYCRRYRPAARHAQQIDSGMSHIGFRCVVRSGGERSTEENA